jgi:large subunit ribosomal protein L32e
MINKDLLQARKKVADARPKFVRQESWRYDRLAENWRKPRGKDNKMRKQMSGVPRIVKIGYRGPKKARHLHPSGYIDHLVFTVNDLGKLDPTKDAARLAHTLSIRKRKEIIDKGNSLGIKILNAGNLASQISNNKGTKSAEQRTEEMRAG